MRIRHKVLVELQERLAQLGMQSCHVCGSGQLLLDKRPGIVTVRGFHHEREDPRWDPESNVLFTLMTCCDLCGNRQFFDIERLIPGTSKVFAVGRSEEEELEQEDGEP